MEIRPRSFYVLVLIAASIAAGCRFAEQSGANSDNRQTANATPASATPASSPSNATTAATSEPPKPNLPKSRDIDLQANHPNGAMLRVSRVGYAEDSISLDFAVTNGHRSDIKLAQGGMQLRDNLGNVYNLSPPPQDADIRVVPNNNLKGKLTFLGRVAPNATSLTLTTNYKYNSISSEHNTTPTMVIGNIPVER